MNKTKKKGGAAVAAPMGVGLLAGHTLAKKTREGESWFSHMLGSYLDLVWYLSKSFIKAGTYAYKEAVIYSIDYVFGQDITAVTLEDLTAEVKTKLIKSAKIAAAISQDDDAMKNLQDTGKLSAEILGNILLAAEEPLQDATNEAVDLLEEICLTLAKSGVDISIGILGAIFGAIPFLGGLINLFIASGYVFNSVTRSMSSSVEGVGKISQIVSASTGKIADGIIPGVPPLMAAVAKAESDYDSAVKDVENSMEAKPAEAKPEGAAPTPEQAKPEGAAPTPEQATAESGSIPPENTPSAKDATANSVEGADNVAQDKNQQGGMQSNFGAPLLNKKLLYLINKIKIKEKISSEMTGGRGFSIPVKNKKGGAKISKSRTKKMYNKFKNR